MHTTRMATKVPGRTTEPWLAICRIKLRLKVRISSIDGTMLAWLPPPPGDRIWTAFTSIRELNLTAKPVVRCLL